MIKKNQHLHNAVNELVQSEARMIVDSNESPIQCQTVMIIRSDN